MKKIWIVVLSLLLISCNDRANSDPIDTNNSLANNTEIENEIVENNNLEENEVVENEVVENETSNDEVLATEEIKTGWALDLSLESIKLDYEPPVYKAVNERFTYDLDKLENLDQFTGFTEGQLAMLEKNGFVVIQPLHPPMKMHHDYEFQNYLGDQMFITSDIMVYLYHLLYSGSMKEFEITLYYEDLKDIVKHLNERITLAYEENPSENLKTVHAYIGVANSLIGNKSDYPQDVKNMIDEELLKIEGAAGYQVSNVFDSELDYSQYIVRGHYSQSDKLSAYFKTMMWLSQWGFQLTEMENEVEKVNIDEVKKAMLLTYFLLMNEEDTLKYGDLYELTSLYSGESDDLNILDIKDMMMDVLDSIDIEAIENTQNDQDLEVAVLALRDPSINHRHRTLALGKQFRFMGQRYSLDAEVMQNLVYPILKPLPSAYEYLTVLGHETAEEILYEYYPTNQEWPEYDTALQEMKDYVAGLDDTFFRKDLYSGWLWSIDAAAQSQNLEGMPSFMRSEAWDLKNLNAALGSFAELKHDNILYSKQVCAEMGGYMPEVLKHYIEPNVELYARLLWLTENMKANLEDRVTEDQLRPIEEVIDIYQLALDISIKELENEALTEEEVNGIGAIGGLCDYVDWHYLNIMEDPSLMGPDSSALIADIATATHTYNEIATGMPMDIYVMTPINGHLYLTSGTVYSFYEFWSEKRLTDEEWQGMIGIKENDYGFNTYIDNGWSYTDMMPWNTYVSPEKANIEYQAEEADYE